MEYISHEDYKRMMGKFQAEAPKGKLLKESWRSDPTDEEGEAYSEMLIDEFLKLFKDGKISKDQLDAADDYINDHDYELFAASHDYDGFDSIGYILKQIGASVEEGNAFTAGLAKAKKGEEFNVGGKTFKDKTNYDAPIKETDGEAKILGHVKNDIYKVQTPTGEVIDVDFDLETGDRVDDYGWEGTLVGYDDEYEYILPVGLVPMGGGAWDVNPYYKEFSAYPLKKKVDEYQFDQMYPDDPGPFEGKDVDNMIKEFLLKEDDVNWDRMDDEEAEENETDNGIEESSKEVKVGDIVRNLNDEDVTVLKIYPNMKAALQAHPEEEEWVMSYFDNYRPLDKEDENRPWYFVDLDGETALEPQAYINKIEEGLNPAPFQATGPTIQTVEEKRSKLAHLSSEERDQLKQYVETIKTVQEQIKKMMDKTEVEEGGDMTNLVMKTNTVSEEGAVDAHEEIESKIDPKLHDTFHKVLDMVTKQLLNAGVEESQVQEFLKHEVSEMPDFVTRMYEKK